MRGLPLLLMAALGACGSADTTAAPATGNNAMAMVQTAAPVPAPAFPELTGPVVDSAALLPANTAKILAQRLAAFRAETSHHLVVATIPSLNGIDIQRYATDLGNHWKLGEKNSNGAILLVAPAEKQVRIATGTGLSRLLPDDVAAAIIQVTILPHFRQGDMAGGIIAGSDDMMGMIRDAEAKARGAKPAPAEPASPLPSTPGTVTS